MNTDRHWNHFDPVEHGCRAIVLAWFCFTRRNYAGANKEFHRAHKCARTLAGKIIADRLRRAAKEDQRQLIESFQ